MRSIIVMSTILIWSLLLGPKDISNTSNQGVALALNELLLAPVNQQGPHWGEFRKDTCSAPGLRQYSSILWDAGSNWEAACEATGATIEGHEFARPTRCEKEMVGLIAKNMWGEFDVPDDSCRSSWDPFKPDRCTGPGVRQYSAILRVSEGRDWESECTITGATILGQQFDKPTRCVKEMVGLAAKNMWGEFDVQDESCQARWDTFKPDKCVAVGVRQYSAQLLVPFGLAWETCSGIGATILEQKFDKPARCKNEGIAGMWGEFNVKDDSCNPKWEPLKADQCIAVGLRQYSAQLLVPDGLSWEVACETTAATIQGGESAMPTRCKNEGIAGMWGEFDVPDKSCLSVWSPFKEDQCVDVDKRQYSSQLLVPDGLSWEVACSEKSATILEQKFASPARCKNAGVAGMWGEFDVLDATCKPYWGEIKRDHCTGTKTRQYSAILWNIPKNLSWERSCQLTAATVAGQDFSKPSRCVNVNLNIWGEFDVKDRFCAIEYPLTRMSWQTIVASVVVLIVVVGLVVLGAKFSLIKKILNALHKDKKIEG